MATAALAPPTSSDDSLSSVDVTVPSGEESLQLDGADLLVAQVSDYDEIEFEIFEGRTQPGGLPRPAAIIATHGDALKLDTTDAILFHGNSFDVLQDLSPGQIAAIENGVAKGVLEDIFDDDFPGQGASDDLFVFAQTDDEAFDSMMIA